MDHYFHCDIDVPPVATEPEASTLHPSSFGAATYGLDVDQMLAQAAIDDDPYAHQHYFTSSFGNPASNDFISPLWEDVEVDYLSQWMSYAIISPKQCEACQIQKAECHLTRDTLTQGTPSCTLCTSQSLVCSLSNDHEIGSMQPMAQFPPAESRPFQDEQELVDGFGMQGSHETSPLPSPALVSGADIQGEFSGSSVKIGARFPRDTVRMLRHWLSTHQRHPYPTEEEKEELKSKTGLSKVQITNWLANARRRGLIKVTRCTSSTTDGPSKALRIRGRSKEKILENMGPMERWQHSPPENEPAKARDIARAFNSSVMISNTDSPSSYPAADEGSVGSRPRGSSASSFGTPVSSGSQESAHSHHSRASMGPFSKRGRRRRRPTIKSVESLALSGVRQYLCSFCVESFKTKYDWQRHEKSLHLSLERWICAPNGSSVPRKTDGAPTCVFCGIENPSNAHLEIHNYTCCLERSHEERTFYRRDHIRQHLRLVHDCKLSPASMDAWKIAIPNVRSRCGFCNLDMDTWDKRVDHLAEHFKNGETMADWKGDWGFEPQIQRLVENCILPRELAPITPIPSASYLAIPDVRPVSSQRSDPLRARRGSGHRERR